MKLSCKSRAAATLFVLISLLFSQVALAWYQCPGDDVAAVGATVSTSSDAGRTMPGCEGMDMDQSALCHAHAQSGTQSLDKPHAPAAQPYIAAVLAVVLPDESRREPLSIAPDARLLTRDVAPTIAVRNCCFRI